MVNRLVGGCSLVAPKSEEKIDVYICMCYYRKFNFDNNQSHGKRKDGGIKFEILVKTFDKGSSIKINLN